jgi:hypothetical protein
MKRKLLYCSSAWLILFMQACSITDPQVIVDKAIEGAGGAKYLNSKIEFNFRERLYRAQREGGKFSYERIFKDGDKNVHDFLTNEGFSRIVNDTAVEVADTMKVKYRASVNSVIYFALLPYALNDPSVHKKFLGETTLEGNAYYKVQINFSAQGGGEDYEDTFIYWFSKKDFTIGYLAYSYNEGKGVDYRFRKAYNPRKVNGILFFDYVNYMPKGNTKIDLLEAQFKNNELEELSKIELTDITVQ